MKTILSMHIVGKVYKEENMKKIIILVVLIIFSATNTYAFYWDGYQLKDLWEDYRKWDNNSDVPTIIYLNASAYMAFVIGVSDFTDLFIEKPENVEVQQVCYITGNYLEKHPEIWSIPAFRIVFDAISEIYPRRK